MNAARQLATHGVKTVVMKICSSLDTAMELEHSLYRLTGHKTVTRTSGNMNEFRLFAEKIFIST